MGCLVVFCTVILVGQVDGHNLTFCGRRVGSFRLFYSVEAGNKLGLIHICSVVAAIVVLSGAADGVVSAVGTEAEIAAVAGVANNGLQGLIPSVGQGRHIGSKHYIGNVVVLICRLVCFHRDVSLYIAVHEVQVSLAYLAFDLLQIYIHSLGGIGAGSHILAALCAGEEVDITQGYLVHTELVGCIFHRLGHQGLVAGLGGSIGLIRLFGYCVFVPQIQMCGIAVVILQACFLDGIEGHMSAVGAHIVVGAVHIGIEGVILLVISKDGFCGGAVYKVDMCAVFAGLDADVLLLTVVEGQVVAVISLLQYDVYAVVKVHIGSTVVIAHLAGEEVMLTLAGLIEAQLVYIAHYGIIDHHSSAGLLVRYFAACWDVLYHILGRAAAGDNVGGGGCTQGAVGAVCTQAVSAAVEHDHIHAGNRIIVPVLGGLGGHSGTALALVVQEDLDILLGAALLIEEADALAAVVLNKHLYSVLGGLAGSQVAAGHTALEVEHLIQTLLVQLHIVGGVFLQAAEVDRCGAGAHGPIVQVCSVELNGAIVVLDNAGYSDPVGDTDACDAVALHIVALEHIPAVDDHGNGDIVIVGVISSVHTVDGAGQSCDVGQAVAIAQLGQVSQNLGCVVGGLLCDAAAADALDHHTAGIKFNSTLVVLDHTGNGDQVVDGNFLNAITLHTVADDGILRVAVYGDLNRDVAVVGIIGGGNSGNSTGQSGLIRQRSAVRQCVSGLQDLTGIGGSLNGVALFDLLTDTAGVEFDGAFVILDGTGNGDDIANQNVLNTLALHTVAQNGHILCALYGDHHGDVVVGGVIDLVDGDDFADQTGLIGQTLTGLQCVSGLNQLDHIHALGQDVVPGVGCHIAGCVGNGCSQLVGGFGFCLFVHVHGHSAVAVVDDHDQVFAYVYGPYHIKGNAGDADHSHTGVVNGGDRTVVQVVGHQILDRIVRSCNYLCCGYIVGFVRLTATGKAADSHGQDQQPCNNFFHSKLLFIFGSEAGFAPLPLFISEITRRSQYRPLCIREFDTCLHSGLQHLPH